MKARTLMPCAETHLRAFCQVLKEYIAHSPVGGAVIDKKIGLKIILEAAEIKIGGSGSNQRIIHNHRFGMKHPRLVKINLDSCLQTLRDV